MKSKIKISVQIVLVLLISLLPCKKRVDDSSGLLSQSQPPVANAGLSQVISLPTDSVELSGSGTDSDGNIIGFRWNKISGPPALTVTGTLNTITQMVSLNIKGKIYFWLLTHLKCDVA